MTFLCSASSLGSLWLHGSRFLSSSIRSGKSASKHLDKLSIITEADLTRRAAVRMNAVIHSICSDLLDYTKGQSA